MSNLISKKIRGFRDILPSEASKFIFIENIINKMMLSYNAEQVRLPALESLNLFKRSIGETSDIVTKEMYSFDDRNGDTLCMIPEGTASCLRLALENNLIYDRGPKKKRLYYIAPMFRHERPQKGRYRQFTQFGVEFYGDQSYHDDIDLLLFISNLFIKLDINDIKLHLNTIGCNDDRQRYSSKLIEYFSRYENHFTDEQQKTLSKNPLRLLDTKDPSLQDIVSSAPSIDDFINKNAKQNFDLIKNELSNLNIAFVHDTKLVRGLDYYNDLVFEWKTSRLGSQDAVCAGGRYDQLSSIIGDKEIPAVGFAMGLDRVVELFEDKNTFINIGLANISEKNHSIQKLVQHLRDLDCDFKLKIMDNNKTLTKQIKQADKEQCELLIIVGDNEISNNMLTVKHLRTDQKDRNVSLAEIKDIILESS
jgi:histidyl-tRNA synthetase